MINDDEKLFTSSDFPLVVSLSLFAPIINLEASHPDRIIFAFEYTDKLTKLIESYWRGKLRIEPLRFYSQQKIVKNRLIEARGRA